MDHNGEVEIIKEDLRKIFKRIKELTEIYNSLNKNINDINTLNISIIGSIVWNYHSLFKTHLPKNIVKSQEFISCENLLNALISDDINVKKRTLRIDTNTSHI